MFLEIINAKYLNNYKILLGFSDGITKIVDLQEHLEGAIFLPLKDKKYFKSFSINLNTIEWENGADFAPEFLYEIGIPTKKIVVS